MLVLTRKKNESLMIGDNIEIIVVDIQGDQVRLGINAPKNVTVHRREVFDEIAEANRAAVIKEQGLEELLKSARFNPAKPDDDK